MLDVPRVDSDAGRGGARGRADDEVPDGGPWCGVANLVVQVRNDARSPEGHVGTTRNRSGAGLARDQVNGFGERLRPLSVPTPTPRPIPPKGLDWTCMGCLQAQDLLVRVLDPDLPWNHRDRAQGVRARHAHHPLPRRHLDDNDLNMDLLLAASPPPGDLLDVADGPGDP